MRFAVMTGGAGATPHLRRLAALLLPGWLAVAVLVPPAHATPYTPADDAEVLERLPDALDPAGREARALHRQLAASPQDMALALRVAALDLDQGRASADPRYLGRAEAALAPWPDDAAVPPQVTLLRAVLRQGAHDFAAARAGLARVLAAEPGNAQAWLTRASIAAVQADYAGALADCGQVARLAPGLPPAVCTAAVMALTGHARLAAAALQLALDDADGEPDGVRRWALTVAAETDARLGDAARAEALYRQALALPGTDAYLLGSYADFLLDARRDAEVAALLRDDARIDPLLLRLAIAEDRLGAPAAAGHVADLRARFATQRLRGESIHQREEARFTLALLRDPAEALRLARANWRVQREPADARILLEAARAAGLDPAAEPAAAWLRDNHVEDVAMSTLLGRAP